MLYHLANTNIAVILNDDGTASILKHIYGKDFLLTGIRFWNQDDRHVFRLCDDRNISSDELFSTVSELRNSGCGSESYPIREMAPGEPLLGVRVFAKPNTTVLLQVKLGSLWVDIVDSSQVFITYKKKLVEVESNIHNTQ